MNNFCRALKLTLRYRWTVAGAFLFSFLVAVLWGGNIGALYPVIQVAFQGQSLQAWMDDEIEESERRILDFRHEITSLQQHASAPNGGLARPRQTVDGSRAPSKQVVLVQYELEAEQRTLAARQRLKPWIDRWLPHDPFKTVALIVVMLIGATMLKGVFIFCSAICVARLEQRLAFDLRREFYHQALRLDLAAFGQERTSGLLSRFNTDIGFLSGGVKNLFGSALREPLKMTACLIGASLISWRLLVFSLILAPLVGFFVRRLAGSIKRANRRVMEEISQLYGVLTETFNGIQTVQAYTLEHHERSKFRKVSKQCLQKGMRIAYYSSLTKPVTETMGIMMISLALLAGAYLTLNGKMHLFGIRMCDRPLDVPSLLIFYGMLIGTTEPARKLSEIFNSIQAGIAASDRLFPLLDQEPSIINPKTPKPLPVQHRTLSFRGVNFSYTQDTPVLNDVDLTIRFGETIAIVGPNGCGKTTLVQMLPRFFDPTDGVIRIDDVDIRDVRLRELRERIGLVTQQSVLFDDTVHHNIRAGKLDATDEEVTRAAQKARAHRFITEKLADGYQTVVGMGGSRLSGGQRQRIALARAILRDPEILILDEATSQVDLQSERLIHQALAEFARGRTVLMVTHRLATLALADRILVMNGGRVESFDTHENLLKSSPVYQQLYSAQFQRAAG